MPLSFNQDIRPLFRDSDIDTMKGFNLNLSDYDDVRTHASEIFDCLSDGSMPCDGAWPAEQIGRFKQWMDEGMAP